MCVCVCDCMQVHVGACIKVSQELDNVLTQDCIVYFSIDIV